MNTYKINKKYFLASIITCIAMQQLYSQNMSFDLTKLIHSFYQSSTDQIPDASTTNIKSIIFDLDGVLCSTNKMQAFYEIGIPTTFNYIYDQGQLPSEKALFDILAGAPAKSVYKSYNKGLLMPQIMIDWQTGLYDGILDDYHLIQYLASKNLSLAQETWAYATFKMMTSPKNFIATRQLTASIIPLLHALKNHGYKLYILSNWDKDSFPLFKKSFPQLFTYNGRSLFDGIMISGDVGILKPELGIFKNFVEKFNIQPEQAIFIDDEPANVQAASAMNLNTILANPADTKIIPTILIEILKNNKITA